MKIKTTIFSLLLLGCISNNVFAENLVDIYNQAYSSDPQFKAANAQWLANKENLPISVANLLPQINALGSVARNLNHLESSSFVDNPRYFNNVSKYSFTLTQSIFNLGSWATVWGAQAQVKQAEATFLSAFESLLVRSSQAYFSVLQAQDILRFTEAKKEQFKRMLEQNQHRYDVGLIAITDLENTKASYDQSVAEEIAAKKSLSDTIEQLAAITGKRYCTLTPLKERFPLLSPTPADIERWVKVAELQNYDLAATSFYSQYARENIIVKNAGHVPTISGNVGYLYNHDNNVSGTDDFMRSKTGTAGLTLTIPIFSGGGVTAAAHQAEYQYQQALSNQEYMHRTVVSNTRQTYLGVLADISKVNADHQLVKSRDSSLRSMEAGYSVGTRTMVDVLQATSDYYNAQQTLAKDEYDFIKQFLLLKSYAAVLGVDDIQQINSWLVAPPACDHHIVKEKCLEKTAQVVDNKNSRNKVAPPKK